MEWAETSMSLQKIFDLIFIIFSWKPTDEKFTGTIIHLSTNDAESHSI